MAHGLTVAAALTVAGELGPRSPNLAQLWQAERLLAAAERLHSVRYQFAPAEREATDRLQSRLRDEVGDEEAAIASTQGAAWPYSRAIDEALRLTLT